VQRRDESYMSVALFAVGPRPGQSLQRIQEEGGGGAFALVLGKRGDRSYGSVALFAVGYSLPVANSIVWWGVYMVIH